MAQVAKRGALAKLLPGLNKSKAEKKRRSNPIFHDIGHVGRKTGITVKQNINKDDNGFENLDDFFQTSTPQDHQIKSARKVKKPVPPSTLGKPLVARSSNQRADPTTPYPAKEPKKKLDLSAITPKPPPSNNHEGNENDGASPAPATASTKKTPKTSIAQQSILLQSGLRQSTRKSTRTSTSPVVESVPAEPENEDDSEELVDSHMPAPENVLNISTGTDIVNVSSTDISTPVDEDIEPDMDFDDGESFDMGEDNGGDEDNQVNDNTDMAGAQLSMDEADIDDDDAEITINLGRRQSLAPAVAAELAQKQKSQQRRRSYFPDDLIDEEEEENDASGDETFAIDDSMLQTVDDDESETEALDATSMAVDKSFVDEIRQRHMQSDDEEELDENGVPIRRSKRRRINVLQYWKNERMLLQRRRSGGIELKGVVKAEQTPDVQPKKRKSRPSLGTELRQAGFAEKENPKLIVKVGDKEQPMSIACTSQMVSMVPLEATGEGENVLVGKAFSRHDFASGVIHIPPMTTKPSANTGGNTLVVYVLSGKVQVTVNRATFLMTSGCHFFIPKENQYELANEERKSMAKLVFFQHKG